MAPDALPPGARPGTAPPGAPAGALPPGARILVVTDAWAPQVNGVVRTLATVAAELRAGGDVVEVIGPDRFRTLPLPGYAEIRLAVRPAATLARLVDAFAPDSVHVATEGPLGWAARALCRARGWPFTTSFHTLFPDYLHARTGLPTGPAWAALRRFHGASAATFVATASLRRRLEDLGFARVRPWTRGVDLDRFHPDAGAAAPDPWAGLARPVFLCAGRVSVEKNLEAFLALDLPGSKVIVGDGPQRAALERRFPAARFTGWRADAELAAAYARADVFVFPSRTDTFGLVLLEAMASGTPVAAFPVTGPLDVVGEGPGGVLDVDLGRAARAALAVDRAAARAHAERFGWPACAAMLREGLAPVRTARAA